MLYPELRKRGLRVLPGGDYGFPNNPIGRNARDLELFVRLFGYSPAEALRATMQCGGQVMDLPVGLLTPGYLADVLVVHGDPAQDVSVLQNTGNLLAIMQNGAFHKLSGQLPGRMTSAVRQVPDLVYREVPGYRPLELDLYLPAARRPGARHRARAWRRVAARLAPRAAARAGGGLLRLARRAGLRGRGDRLPAQRRGALPGAGAGRPQRGQLGPRPRRLVRAERRPRLPLGRLRRRPPRAAGRAHGHHGARRRGLVPRHRPGQPPGRRRRGRRHTGPRA